MPTVNSQYELQASQVGYAATYVAFAISFLVMLIIERIASSTLVLLARMIWGVNSVPDGCLEEPMRTVAEQLKGSTTGSFLTYLETLSDTAESSPQDGVKGYASMQMVGAGVSFFSSIGGSIAGSLVDGLTALSGYLAWMAILTLFFSLLFLVQVSLTSIRPRDRIGVQLVPSKVPLVEARTDSQI